MLFECCPASRSTFGPSMALIQYIFGWDWEDPDGLFLTQHFDTRSIAGYGGKYDTAMRYDGYANTCRVLELDPVCDMIECS